MTSPLPPAPAPTGPTTAVATPRTPDVPSNARRVLPGVAASVAAAALCIALNHAVPIASPLLLAIVLGVVAANVRPLPTVLQPGLNFSAKRLLRVGIVLLGLQLSLQDVAGLGASMLAVVVVVVVVGITATLLIGSSLRVSWSQSILIACGFSICGAAAVAATDGVVDAEEDEVATSIALVVVFGTAMIAVVPALSALLGLDARIAGLWAGTSVHEVAQVVAAGGAIGGGALAVAVVAKLARVLMLAPVMAVLGIYRRHQIRKANSDAEVRMPPLVPLFVVGFALMVAIASLLTIPTGLAGAVKQLQTGLLAAAMFALGCGVRRSALRAVGPRPLVLALFSTVVVATVSLGGVLLVS